MFSIACSVHASSYTFVKAIKGTRPYLQTTNLVQESLSSPWIINEVSNLSGITQRVSAVGAMARIRLSLVVAPGVGAVLEREQEQKVVEVSWSGEALESDILARKTWTKRKEKEALVKEVKRQD